MTKLTETANDGESFGVQVAFKDTDATAVTPTSATWSLYNQNDSIVNSREDVSISSPGSTEVVVLGPSDTAYSDGKSRKLVVTFVYDSATLGVGQTGVVVAEFDITNVPG